MFDIRLGALLLVVVASLLIACGGGGDSASPNSATLSWNAVTAVNLAGYRVYYGTTPGAYFQAVGQGLDVGNATTYTITDLSSGTRYYFAATAYDTSNNESAFSNEVFKDLP